MPLAFRQIHLDFHTAQQIAGVGAKFDAEAFADTLAGAHVNSVNLFARCHHGYLYFDSPCFPERRHPHLKVNLLAKQIEACHARGIKTPLYTTVQWDYFTAQHHPEWLAIDENGRIQGPGPFEAGFRQNLLVNSPYQDFLKAHVAELFELFPIDGLWFDIVKPLDDCSVLTQQQMRASGLDPSNQQIRQDFGLSVIRQFKHEMTAFVRQFSQNCLIFYNEGHVSPAIHPALQAYSHLELESLPSGEWGYVHFPATARYARTLPKQLIGMTGKFHTEWGDFHSYKNQEALEYECFQMLALGAGCSIGDQLHPDGVLDAPTYQLIGAVYAEVARKEPWCANTEAITEIGVMLPNPESARTLSRPDLAARVPKAVAGACRMLEALGHQFDFVSFESDLSRYTVLILPDDIRLTETQAVHLKRYCDAGGKVIASHQSGLLENATFPAFFGIEYLEEARYHPDFLVPQDALKSELPAHEYVMYLRGNNVRVEPGTQVLATVQKPYFNRTYEHFMSHRHAPSAGEPVYPGVTRHKDLIYFAHPLFRLYQHNAPRWCRTLLHNVLQMLLPSPLVTHAGPSTLQLHLRRMKDEDRYILHALHYLPLRRSDTIDVIEDVLPLYNLALSVRLPPTKCLHTLRSVPDGGVLEFQQVADRVRFILPQLVGHHMLELDFSA